MRYSVIGGGKRVRPLLVYAVGQIFDADPENLDLTALAVECVHSYSLIHDDLPCMDNDILRHGKPTTHAALVKQWPCLQAMHSSRKPFCS